MQDYAALEAAQNMPSYPPADKQYDGASKYTTYESIQTGATGKLAK